MPRPLHELQDPRSYPITSTRNRKSVPSWSVSEKKVGFTASASSLVLEEAHVYEFQHLDRDLAGVGVERRDAPLARDHVAQRPEHDLFGLGVEQRDLAGLDLHLERVRIEPFAHLLGALRLDRALELDGGVLRQPGEVPLVVLPVAGAVLGDVPRDVEPADLGPTTEVIVRVVDGDFEPHPNAELGVCRKCHVRSFLSIPCSVQRMSASDPARSRSISNSLRISRLMRLQRRRERTSMSTSEAAAKIRRAASSSCG